MRCAAFDLIGRTIVTQFENVIVSPYVTVGMTDARHYNILTDRVYRFMPIIVSSTGGGEGVEKITTQT